MHVAARGNLGRNPPANTSEWVFFDPMGLYTVNNNGEYNDTRQLIPQAIPGLPGARQHQSFFSSQTYVPYLITSFCGEASFDSAPLDTDQVLGEVRPYSEVRLTDGGGSERAMVFTVWNPDRERHETGFFELPHPEYQGQWRVGDGAVPPPPRGVLGVVTGEVMREAPFGDAWAENFAYADVAKSSGADERWLVATLTGPASGMTMVTAERPVGAPGRWFPPTPVIPRVASPADAEATPAFFGIQRKQIAVAYDPISRRWVLAWIGNDQDRIEVATRPAGEAGLWTPLHRWWPPGTRVFAGRGAGFGASPFGVDVACGPGHVQDRRGNCLLAWAGADRRIRLLRFAITADGRLAEPPPGAGAVVIPDAAGGLPLAGQFGWRGVSVSANPLRDRGEFAIAASATDGTVRVAIMDPGGEQLRPGGRFRIPGDPDLLLGRPALGSWTSRVNGRFQGSLGMVLAMQ